MTKKYDDLNVIKQIVGLQNLSNADLDKMWRKFFDDRPENTEAAEQLGIKTYTITSKEYLLSVLDEYLKTE